MQKNSYLSLFLKLPSVVLILVGCFTTICNATQHKVTLETFKEIGLSGDMDVNIVITNESQQYVTSDVPGILKATVEKNCLKLRGDFGKKITLYTPRMIEKVNVWNGKTSIDAGKLTKNCSFIVWWSSQLVLGDIEADSINLTSYCGGQITVNNVKANNFKLECDRIGRVVVKTAVDISSTFKLKCHNGSHVVINNDVKTNNFTLDCKAGKVTIKNMDVSCRFELKCHNAYAQVNINKLRIKNLYLDCANMNNVNISGTAETIIPNNADVSNVTIKPYIELYHIPVALGVKMFKSNKAKTYGDILIFTEK